MEKPRGNRRRGSEVLRINTLVATNVIGERLLRTLVLSDTGDIYEYKRLTKRVCGAFLDWSANWACIGNKGPITSNQWLEMMKARGWFKPTIEEAHLKHLKDKPIFGGMPSLRQHKKNESAKLGSKPNPGIKQGPTRLIDSLRRGIPRSMKSTFNKLERENERLNNG